MENLLENLQKLFTFRSFHMHHKMLWISLLDRHEGDSFGAHVAKIRSKNEECYMP